MLVRIKKKEDFELCKGDLVLAMGKFYSFEEAEKFLGTSFKGVLTIRNIMTNEERQIVRGLNNGLQYRRINEEQVGYGRQI